jgi:patched 2 protein
MKDNSWGAWKLQFLSTCSVFWAYEGRVPSSAVGWGITRFPCTKLTPLDYFKEGGGFDYPEELKLLERPLPNLGLLLNLTLIDVILGMYQMLTALVKCVNLLRTNISTQFQESGRPVVVVDSVCIIPRMRLHTIILSYSTGTICKHHLVQPLSVSPCLQNLAMNC